MEKYKAKTKTNDRAFIIIGFTVLGTIFLLYSRMNDFSITADSLQSIERLATGFYVILLLSLAQLDMVFIATTNERLQKMIMGCYQLLPKLPWMLSQKKSLLLHSLPMAYFFH